MELSWSSFSRHDVVVVAVVVVVMEVVVSCFKDFILFYFNVRYWGKMNLFRRIIYNFSDGLVRPPLDFHLRDFMI